MMLISQRMQCFTNSLLYFQLRFDFKDCGIVPVTGPAKKQQRATISINGYRGDTGETLFYNVNRECVLGLDGVALSFENHLYGMNGGEKKTIKEVYSALSFENQVYGEKKIKEEYSDDSEVNSPGSYEVLYEITLSNLEAYKLEFSLQKADPYTGESLLMFEEHRASLDCIKKCHNSFDYSKRVFDLSLLDVAAYSFAILPKDCKGYAKRKKAVEHIIQKFGDINQKNKHGNTVLHFAIKYCSPIDFIELLVEKGADINSKNKQGYTPLHLFLENMNMLKPSDGVGKSKLFFLLLRLGADANIGPQPYAVSSDSAYSMFVANLPTDYDKSLFKRQYENYIVEELREYIKSEEMRKGEVIEASAEHQRTVSCFSVSLSCTFSFRTRNRLSKQEQEEIAFEIKNVIVNIMIASITNQTESKGRRKVHRR